MQRRTARYFDFPTPRSTALSSRQTIGHSLVLLFVIGLSSCGSPAMAADSDVRRPSSQDEGSEAGSRPRVAEALAEETQIVFFDLPFDEAMQALAELHEVTITLDEAALRAAKIDPAQPVNRDLDGITLRTGLNIFLPEHGLDWYVKDGKMIFVTTQAAAARRMETKTYSLDPLDERDIASNDLLRVLDEAFGLRKSDARDRPAIVSMDDDDLTIRHARRGHEEVARLLTELEAVATGMPRFAANDGEKRILAALRKPSKALFVENYLEDVLAYLADIHLLVIVADWKTLAAKNIDEETAVDFIHEDVRVDSALSLILREKGMDWIVADGFLLVTTDEAAAAKRTARPYSLVELEKAGIAADDVVKALETIFRSRRNDEKNRPTFVRVKNDLLVVRDHRQGHARLARLLADLRAAVDRKDAPFLPRERKLHDELAKPTFAAFEATPLSHILDFFGDLHEIDWVLDRPAFSKEFLKKEPEVSLGARKNYEGPLASALDRILVPLDATYLVEHEVLLVTTSATAEKRPVVQVHDLRGIVRDADQGDDIREAVQTASQEPPSAKKTPRPTSARIGDSFLVFSASAPRQRALKAALSALRRNRTDEQNVSPPNPKHKQP